MGDHDIIGVHDGIVECACGWSGGREAHLTHRVADTGREGVAAARQALKEAGEDPA
jgi:hypothetical protein